MQTNTIDPTAFDPKAPFSMALRLVSRHWFMAYSKLMAMQWEWTTDPSYPYGATDGRTLLLNAKGIDKLSAQPNGAGLIAFLLVHEALHALLGHGWRCAGMKDQHTANVAADYIINAMIAQRNRELRAAPRGPNHDVFPFINGTLLDEALSADHAVEQLYRQLHQSDPEPQPQPNPQPDGPSSDNTSPDPDTQEGDGDPDSAGDAPPQQGDGPTNDGGEGEGEGEDGAGAGGTGEPDDSEGVGSGSGSGSGSLDPDSGSPDPDAGDGTGPSGGPDDLSDFVGTGAPDNLAPEADEEAGETLSDVVDQIEEANDRVLVSDAIDRKTQGDSGTTGTRVAMQRRDGSALNWGGLLHEWLNKRSAHGWDAPFNPVIHSATGLVCAGRRGRLMGDIVLVIDTSGSVGAATLTRFLQEAQEILDTLKPAQMHLLSVSHIVCDALPLEEGDIVPDRIKGGGGTRFLPAFDWVRENDIDVDVMVYLTDGLSSDRNTIPAPDYPLLWLSTRTPARDYAIGEVVMVDAP